MQVFIEEATVFLEGKFHKRDIFIADGVVREMEPFLPHLRSSFSGRSFRNGHFFISPGFVDTHVHLREPGYTHKATIASETRAAMAGGFTHVGAMPNLNPCPDSIENLKLELDILERDAVCDVLPYGCITKEQAGKELADIKALSAQVAGFSDDGMGVDNDSLMRQAFLLAKEVKKPILAHCEVKSLTRGGPIHDGVYAQKHGLVGNPSESEWKMVERDIALVRETGARFHICHVSTKESVALIRAAQQEGLPITAETCPHYLYFTDADLEDDGGFRMNPPIRSAEDRSALREAFIDGTFSMLTTDHAPHSASEKAGGLRNSLNGVVGLETSFAAVNTCLVQSGKMSLEKLMERMVIEPRRFLGLSSEIQVGKKADLVVFDPFATERVEPERFLSQGKSGPFNGLELQGKILFTCFGNTVYVDGKVVEA